MSLVSVLFHFLSVNCEPKSHFFWDTLYLRSSIYYNYKLIQIHHLQDGMEIILKVHRNYLHYVKKSYKAKRNWQSFYLISLVLPLSTIVKQKTHHLGLIIRKNESDTQHPTLILTSLHDICSYECSYDIMST